MNFQHTVLHLENKKNKPQFNLLLFIVSLLIFGCLCYRDICIILPKEKKKILGANVVETGKQTVFKLYLIVF
jgi:hypothetical protein